MKRLINIIPRGSTILLITSALSYLLGLFRDHFFAQTFGASRSLDAYNAAFLFPDLLFNILIAGGIAAAFVPIFSELLHSDKKRATKYANSIITAATGIMLLTALLIILFAKPISYIVAPGFNSQDKNLVVQLLYLLALSPIFFAASNAIGAMLVTQRRFLFYGLSPVLYNVGIILGTIFLAPHLGVKGIAIGTLSGAFLHLLIRVGDAWWQGFKFKITYQFKTREFRKTLKLMWPKMFGHPVELATFWGFTAIASTLAPGSVAIVSFARNFQSVPISLIGITIATTSFPLLANAMSKKNKDEFHKTIKNSFFLILSASFLSALLIFIIREPLIKIILGGGAFGADDIKKTSATLSVFCLSIPAEALIQLISRAFYATKNTTIPVVVSVLGICIAVPGGYLLSASYGILALPFAFFLASTFKLLVLSAWLPFHMRKINF
ncbi:MAG: murein biosynthesis integral membrane protein MurJ [Candidatus Moranbacteria bacterium]|jgi:putative peptidoglycan lipid II flippase|nr:murein biosynthesis integral membrane protein MurJ [Candidatus Moranbacteria bacterium]